MADIIAQNNIRLVTENEEKQTQ